MKARGNIMFTKRIIVLGFIVALIPALHLVFDVTASSAEVSDCIELASGGNAPDYNFGLRKDIDKEERVTLKLVVSCEPAHEFELSGTEESGATGVMGLIGTNDCTDKKFKTKGEECDFEVFMNPKKPEGTYQTLVTFEYAAESEKYTIKLEVEIDPIC
jgi:hypothetical protein